MLTIDGVVRTLRTVPIAARLGLVLLAVGGTGDVVAHLGSLSAADHVHGFTSPELAAHLAVLMGMVVTLLGVVLDGARRFRPRQGSGGLQDGGT